MDIPVPAIAAVVLVFSATFVAIAFVAVGDP